MNGPVLRVRACQLLPRNFRSRFSCQTTKTKQNETFFTVTNSVDVRGKPLTEARHWSSPATFGDRAKFIADAAPEATLELAVSTSTTSRDARARHRRGAWLQFISRMHFICLIYVLSGGRRLIVANSL